MKINNILNTKREDIISIGFDQHLEAAIGLLTDHNIGALIVMNQHGNLVGILSERDIIHAFAKTADALSLRVDEVMTKDVITGVPEDDVISVAHTMTERRFRHLPVLHEDRLIGIISIGDILKAQRDMYRGEIDTLETQILARD